MIHRARLQSAAALIVLMSVPAPRVDADGARPLTEQELEAMQQSLGREIWPYMGIEIEDADPQDPDAFVGRLVGLWRHGMPRQMLDVVSIAPAHFAPAIRDRLMRLPNTLEEYLLDLKRDDPRYSITVSERMRHFGPPAQRLLVVVPHLAPEHAEPILQEFFDKVNPLALEAERRHWEAKDAALAAGRKTSKEWVNTLEVYRHLSGVRGRAIKVARDFDSVIFYDDFLAMLTSDDPVAQETGANYTRGYLDKIIQKRPEAVARIAEAMPRLLASEDPRVARAGRALMKRLEEGRGAREGDPHNPWRK